MTAPFDQAEWKKIRAASAEALPGLVAELGLPAAFLGYQAKVASLLDSTAAHVLFIEKSRRIGLTWALAAAAVLRAGKAREAGGMDAMYISYSQEMTREFIDAAAMWARLFAVAAGDAEEFLFADAAGDGEGGDRAIGAFRIRFASGFEIVALSSAPRSLRGKQGLVIIDEAAFVDHLKELLKAALAFLMWGGQVVVCSTHNGADNPFNEAVQDILAGRSRFAHLRVDLDDALKDGLYRRICLVTGKEWSQAAEAAWRAELVAFYGDGADEELFCVPAQGSGVWLTAPLIEARMTLDQTQAPVLRLDLPADFLHRGELERRHLLAPFMAELGRALGRLDGECLHAVGYDPARLRDPAVIHVLAVEKRLRRRSALTVEMRGTPFAEQRAIARDIVRAAPRLVGVAGDATGMGMNLMEDLGREFGLRTEENGAGLVLAVNMTAAFYNQAMPPLKAAFEDDAIALARDADHLGDLRLVKVIRGVPAIPAERTDGKGEDAGKGRKRHGDFAVALALAFHASRLQWREYGYEAVGAADAAKARDRFFERPDDDAGSDERARPWWKPPLGGRLFGGPFLGEKR